MQDSLSFRSRLRTLLIKLLLFSGFLLLMAGSVVFHRVEETAPTVKPFGALIFYSGVIVMSLGGIVQGGSMLRGSLVSGREGRGWLLMSLSVLALIGSVLMIGGNVRSVFYENVPERHFLVTMNSDRSSIEFQFKIGWVYRSPFRRAYLVPQEQWSVQFCPEFRDERGVVSPLLLAFTCNVNAAECDKFSAAFAESFKRAEPGQKISHVFLGPITKACEDSISRGLDGRRFGGHEELRHALEDSLQRYFGELGLLVVDVKLIPLPALQQPGPPRIGNPFI